MRMIAKEVRHIVGLASSQYVSLYTYVYLYVYEIYNTPSCTVYVYIYVLFMYVYIYVFYYLFYRYQLWWFHMAPTQDQVVTFSPTYKQVTSQELSPSDVKREPLLLFIIQRRCLKRLRWLVELELISPTL